jgi:hypothetical protein
MVGDKIGHHGGQSWSSKQSTKSNRTKIIHTHEVRNGSKWSGQRKIESVLAI